MTGVEQDLDQLRQRAREAFPSCWRDHFARPFPPEGALRLLHSGAFTLGFDAVRLWVDIVVPRYVDPLPDRDIGRAFADSGLFLLTHLHADHFDRTLIPAAAGNPGFRIAVHADEAGALGALGVPPERIIPVRPGETFTHAGLTLQGIATPHINIDNSLAFHVRKADKDVLILSDIREYEDAFARQLPSHDVLLFNAWFGRRQAVTVNMDMIRRAAAFIAAAAPKHVILLHLYELSRTPEDVWTRHHAALLAEELRPLAPDVEMIIPEINGDVPLP